MGLKNHAVQSDTLGYNSLSLSSWVTLDNSSTFLLQFLHLSNGPGSLAFSCEIII